MSKVKKHVGLYFFIILAMLLLLSVEAYAATDPDDLTFAPRTDYAAGSAPVAVEVCNINGDNHDDIAVLNNASSTVSILLGKGDGTFYPKQDFLVDQAYSFDTGDMNNDGKDEIAVISYTNPCLIKIYGFTIDDSKMITSSQLATIDAAPGFYAAYHGIKIYDVDQDGYQDIIAAISNSNAAKIYWNDGSYESLSFSTSASLTAPFAYWAPSGIVAADFNDDHNIDLVIGTMSSTTSTLSVFYGQGGRVFPNASTISAIGKQSPDSQCNTLAASDLDKDGDLELIAARFYCNNVTVLSNNGGTFSTSNYGWYPSRNTYPADIAVADYNLDGYPDFIKKCAVAGYLDFFANKRDGTFELSNPNLKCSDDTASLGYGIATGDFNEDGKPDIVDVGQKSNTISVHINNFNVRPTITNITDQTIERDHNIDTISFTVGDYETPAAGLTVSANSSNPSLVTSGGIALGGSDANRTLQITPVAGVTGSSTITVTVDDGGKTAVDTFVFTVIPDTVNPTVSTFSPADNSTGVDVGSKLALTFSENVSAVSGKAIYIMNSADNSVVQTITASSINVNTTNNVVTITPSGVLANGIKYYVLIDTGAFKDVAGNEYAGISDKTVWNFTTTEAATVSNSSSNHKKNNSTSGTVSITADGKDTNAGKITTATNRDGMTVNTLVTDGTILAGYIQKASAGSSVVFSVPQALTAATNNVKLTAQTVDNMAQKDMVMTVRSGEIEFSIPAAAVNTELIATTLGAGDNLGAVDMMISMSPASQKDSEALQAAAKSQGFETVGNPVTFELTAVYGGKSLSVARFGSYVSRNIPLASGMDPNRITTAIVDNPDGSVRHVPTSVFKGSDGLYYARVNSLTNSTYVLIYNNADFKDTASKWYHDQACEMVSRKILTGYEDETFRGEQDITRAEFAAIMIRALGLPSDGKCSFSDVSESKWYSGYVGMAYEYGIITGRSDKVFDPAAKITRQEAMAMIKRAAVIAGYTGSNDYIKSFNDMDSVSKWAEDAVAFNLENGLIVGSNGRIRPGDTITRAETATVVLRLLQKADLIDTRSAV